MRRQAPRAHTLPLGHELHTPSDKPLPRRARTLLRARTALPTRPISMYSKSTTLVTRPISTYSKQTPTNPTLTERPHFRANWPLPNKPTLPAKPSLTAKPIPVYPTMPTNQSHRPHPPLPLSPPTSTLLRTRELSDETLCYLLCPALNATLCLNPQLRPASRHPISIFYSASPPGLSPTAYLRRLIRHLRVSRSAFICAHILLRRAATREPLLAPTARNAHRLLLTAVLVAAKTLDDVVAPNSVFARVGGLPNTAEINALERALLGVLRFRVMVKPAEYVAAVADMAARRVGEVGEETGRCGDRGRTEQVRTRCAGGPRERKEYGHFIDERGMEIKL